MPIGWKKTTRTFVATRKGVGFLSRHPHSFLPRNTAEPSSQRVIWKNMVRAV